MISSGYKWMLSGYGNGFVLLKDEVADQLYADTKEAPLSEDAPLLSKSFLSRYFEPGHQDTLTLGSLKQSVLLLEQLGMSFVEDKVQQLTQKAKAAFLDRGLLDQLVANRKDHAPIFKLNLSERTMEGLQKERIIFSKRNGGTRVSFHFYNTEEDLGHLLKVIDSTRLN